MLPKKGWLAYQAYCRFGILPKGEARRTLEASGWTFNTVRTAIDDFRWQIIHPDGKPLDNAGTYGYVTTPSGEWYISPEMHEKRLADFRVALAGKKTLSL